VSRRSRGFRAVCARAGRYGHSTSIAPASNSLSGSVNVVPRTVSVTPPARVRRLHRSGIRVRERSLRGSGAAFGISTRSLQSTADERHRPRRPAMPPNEACPNCHRVVADWHIEWYKTEGPSLYRGLAALDCPLCRQPVGFQGGRIGQAPPGVPLVVRQAEQAAQWAASQAISAGGTLQGYIAAAGAGIQYAAY
jgi:hypothetical protein